LQRFTSLLVRVFSSFDWASSSTFFSARVRRSVADSKSLFAFFPFDFVVFFSPNFLTLFSKRFFLFLNFFTRFSSLVAGRATYVTSSRTCPHVHDAVVCQWATGNVWCILTHVLADFLTPTMRRPLPPDGNLALSNMTTGGLRSSPSSNFVFHRLAQNLSYTFNERQCTLNPR